MCVSDGSFRRWWSYAGSVFIHGGCYAASAEEDGKTERERGQWTSLQRRSRQTSVRSVLVSRRRTRRRLRRLDRSRETIKARPAAGAAAGARTSQAAEGRRPPELAPRPSNQIVSTRSDEDAGFDHELASRRLRHKPTNAQESRRLDCDSAGQVKRDSRHPHIPPLQFI